VTRLYFASDIHASEQVWRKFLNTPSFYGAEVLVMGGDMSGKLLVPMVETKPGVWETNLLGKHQKAKGEERLLQLEERARFNGFYPYRCDPAEMDRLEREPEYREQVFNRAMAQALERWLDMAHDKLAGTGVRLYLMPGNDDPWEFDEVFQRAPEPVENVEGAVVRFDGLQMLSSGWANPTPWDSPREKPEDELYKVFEEVAQDLEEGVPAIFNLHIPPYDSTLDLAPELTDDLRVVSKGGEVSMHPVGSKAVRRFIEERQPILSLHGHIHESRGAVKVGKTVAINPGSTYGEGVLDGAIVDIEDGEVKSYQLVSG
jgi:Icc-related predicted phosphoesterase